VVLLVPVFVFVVASARLSGATRDRRLAALRLVGGSSAQVRRIAAGEALLGSVLGLLVGGGLFLATRPLIEHQELAGVSVFARDIIPSVPLILLIVLAIPVITVGTALFALRDTVIEPLGVVRHTTPPRRRLLWRLVIAAAGVALLLRSDSGSTVPLTLGVILLLLSVPLLLPWLLQRVIGLIRRGKPSWELATARLEMDSATPSRVVSGVAVVLAGAIALFTLMLSADRSIADPTPAFHADANTVYGFAQPASAAQAEQMAAAVRRVPGVHAAAALFSLNARTGPDRYDTITVGTCTSLQVVTHLPSCRDGDVFTAAKNFPAGRVLHIEKNDGTAATVRYRIPNSVKRAGSAIESGDGGGQTPLYATTGAISGIRLTDAGAELRAVTGTDADGALERIRNALAPYTWRVSYVDSNAPEQFSQDAESLDTIRRGLYIGAVLTLALAAASMLVITLEQIRDRRRPLAGLAASGVPRWMLARSLLWQNAIPVFLAVVVSILAGLLLGALTLRIADAPVAFDAVNILALSGIAIGVVAIATALTLPSVWQATRLTTLREE
ncbi:MAG TPA: FtsX-like permease family protein, partial [Mycobacteriales bacterium]|nr:FtsX-like permease family protein [Mycobacteriales bacterium]